MDTETKNTSDLEGSSSKRSKSKSTRRDSSTGEGKQRKKKTTMVQYEKEKKTFQEKNFHSVNAIYNEADFPSWEELPVGIDPQFEQIMDGEQFLTSTRSQVLRIDNIGFEAKLRHWLQKTSDISIETLFENLAVQSEFSKFSKKSKPRKFDVSLNLVTLEIVAVSQRSGREIRVPFSKVDELRIGPKTKAFEVWRNEVIAETQAITIIYNRDQELNLMSKYEHKIQLWVAGLIRIIPLYKGDNTEFSYLSEIWRTQGKKTLPLKIIFTLLEEMKIKVSKDEVKDMLYKRRRDKFLNDVPYGEYVLEDFIALIHFLRNNAGIKEVFFKYAFPSGKLPDEEMLKFIHQEQKECHIKLEDLSTLLEPYREKPDDDWLTLLGFNEYLSGEHGRIFNPYMDNIYQTMDRPLTDYFIYSSHNTYLEGNQLSGWSSSDMYMRVLKAGCRCVELDCWNGDNGEPIIFHGHTLTTKILFEDAVRAIRDYAFVSSDYPVILSIENHCNVPQQTRMAEIMQQYFKENIALPIVGSDRKYLPSPNELKGKILIKGKVDKINLNGYDEDCDQELKVKVAPELAAITYLTSTGFSTFENFFQNRGGCWEISSFVETKLEGLNLSDFVEYNKLNFSRIYPKGSRTMSSNYSPEPFWSGGSQLVALNLQTMGRVAWTNQGKFKDNGGCGYILKPFYMRHDFTDRFDENEFSPHCPIRLGVEVISGRQLPKIKGQDSGSYSVSVSVRGFKCDTKVEITGKARGSFSPVWNKKMEFDIRFPENAVMLFVVMGTAKGIFKKGLSENKVKLGYYSIPISCIRKGYRIIELNSCDDSKNIPLADLLCKFDFNFSESPQVFEALKSRADFLMRSSTV